MTIVDAVLEVRLSTRDGVTSVIMQSTGTTESLASNVLLDTFERLTAGREVLVRESPQVSTESDFDAFTPTIRGYARFSFRDRHNPLAS